MQTVQELARFLADNRLTMTVEMLRPHGYSVDLVGRYETSHGCGYTFPEAVEDALVDLAMTGTGHKAKA